MWRAITALAMPEFELGRAREQSPQPPPGHVKAHHHSRKETRDEPKARAAEHGHRQNRLRSAGMGRQARATTAPAHPRFVGSSRDGRRADPTQLPGCFGVGQRVLV